MNIINGKEIAAATRLELKNEVSALNEKGIKVGLAVIIVGSDPASRDRKSVV